MSHVPRALVMIDKVMSQFLYDISLSFVTTYVRHFTTYVRHFFIICDITLSIMTHVMTPQIFFLKLCHENFLWHHFIIYTYLYIYDKQVSYINTLVYPIYVRHLFIMYVYHRLSSDSWNGCEMYDTCLSSDSWNGCFTSPSCSLENRVRIEE